MDLNNLRKLASKGSKDVYNTTESFFDFAMQITGGSAKQHAGSASQLAFVDGYCRCLYQTGQMSFEDAKAFMESVFAENMEGRTISAEDRADIAASVALKASEIKN